MGGTFELGGDERGILICSVGFKKKTPQRLWQHGLFTLMAEERRLGGGDAATPAVQMTSPTPLPTLPNPGSAPGCRCVDKAIDKYNIFANGERSRY